MVADVTSTVDCLNPRNVARDGSRRRSALLQSPPGSSTRRSIPLRHEGSAALCRLAATSSEVAAFLLGESVTIRWRSGVGSAASVERSGDVAEAPLRRDQAALDLVKAGDDRIIGIVLAALGDTGDP